MNQRETQLLKNRLNVLNIDLTNELHLKKGQRKNVQALQQQISKVKQWLRA